VYAETYCHKAYNDDAMLLMLLRYVKISSHPATRTKKYQSFFCHALSHYRTRLHNRCFAVFIVCFFLCFFIILFSLWLLLSINDIVINDVTNLRVCYFGCLVAMTVNDKTWKQVKKTDVSTLLIALYSNIAFMANEKATSTMP